MFRLLGHHPGAEFSEQAASSLAEADTEAPSRLLTALARAHLIEPAGPGRWTMHDLLRAYAAELAKAAETEAAGRAATRRLADHYLTGAAAAAAALQPAWSHEPGPEQHDVTSAWAWLDTERTNLVAIAGTCGDHRWDRDAITLAGTLFYYLDAGGHFAEGEAIHSHAYDATRRVGDAAAQAAALANLGRVYRREGQLSRAAATYEHALTIYAQLTDRRGEAYARRNLGSVHWRQGRYELAADHYRQAIALYRDSADLAGQADALRSLGLLDERLGRLPAAADQLAEALRLYRQVGDSSGEAYVQSSLGRIQHRNDDLCQAAAKLEENLLLARRTGDRTAEAYALTDLAGAYRHRGRLGEAAAKLQNAVTCLRHIGDTASEVEALNELGEILRALGAAVEAGAAHSAALQRAESIGDRYEEARAHDGIAAISYEADDTDAAEQHWQLALNRYREVNVPDADAVRTRLRELASESGAGTDG
jgi:tetratricopeptide (TPR) repeat protein